MRQPNKTLLIDLEISPNLAWVYGKYETTAIAFERYQYVLSISYKWLGEEKIYTYGLPDFPNWKKSRFDDSAIMKNLWDAMEKADIVVAHNLKKFDAKKSNARFLVNHLDPPKNFKMLDTLTIARSKFGFVGNSLNDLCAQLGIGKKKEKNHSDLWRACIDGDKAAWKHMKEYNAHDVVLLEKLYKRFLPWIDPYPVIGPNNGKCPKCGSTNLKRNGFNFHKTFQRQRYQCISCGNRSIVGEATNYDDL